MIKMLLNFIEGTRDISTERETELYDYLIKEKAWYIKKADGVFRVRSHFVKGREEALAALGCGISAARGLPRYFKRYGRRAGLWIGAVLFALGVALSQRVVWNIEVEGCSDPDAVVKNLADLGFTYGTFFGDVDLDDLHNDYLRTFDDLSWISVNMNGTWAYVETKDLILPKEPDPSAPCNVVAAEAGRIVTVAADEGRPVVKVGDFVSAGDLLIGGVISMRGEELSLKSARGSVTAEVMRKFTIKVPKTAAEKEYTGCEYEEKSLIFFKNKIKLYGNSRISRSGYDKIYYKERAELFGIAPLPVFTEKVIYKEYTEHERKISPDEALDEIGKEYPERVADALSGAKLVSVTYVDSESATEYIRSYEIICVANIAKPKEITLG